MSARSSIIWWLPPSGPTVMPACVGVIFTLRSRVADGVADLVVGATRGEHGERAGERDLARDGETGGTSDHVLLGDADVEEALGVLLGELDGRRGLGEVGVDGDDVDALIGEFDERLAERLAGGLVAHEALPSVSGVSSPTRDRDLLG